MVVLAREHEGALLLHEVETAVVKNHILLYCLVDFEAVMAEAIDLELVVEHVAALASYLFARSWSV